MKTNKVKTKKLKISDGVEVKSATFIDKSFPLHFHKNWSLASIEYGNENISFNNSGFILNKNALVLIPPYSLHKNWGNKNNAWTYKALYIGNDVVKSISKKINIDYSYLASFPYFLTYSKNQFIISEGSIFQTLENLFLETLNNDVQNEKYNHHPFNDLLDYLSTNYNESVTLDSLEKKFKIDKYKLLKKFKKNIGITPLEYQTAIRIENSKQLFYNDIPLVEIALETGFYDQSHFTHSFKKYVGVTPGNYKKNINILQDC